MVVETCIQQKLHQQESLAVMHNLIKICVSQIAWSRGLLPADAFEEKHVKSLADVCVKRLKGDKIPEQGKMLMSWLNEGVLHALEKKYLRKVCFGIYQDASNPDDLLESYEFAVDYEANMLQIECNQQVQASQPAFRAMSREEIKSMATSFVRSLTVFLGTLEAVPGNKHFSIRLLYDEDKTPPNYEPPYFRAHGSLGNLEESNSLPLGKVGTRFHAMQLVSVCAGGPLLMQEEEEEEDDERQEERKKNEEIEGKRIPDVEIEEEKLSNVQVEPSIVTAIESNNNDIKKKKVLRCGQRVWAKLNSNSAYAPAIICSKRQIPEMLRKDLSKILVHESTYIVKFTSNNIYAKVVRDFVVAAKEMKESEMLKNKKGEKVMLKKPVAMKKKRVHSDVIVEKEVEDKEEDSVEDKVEDKVEDAPPPPVFDEFEFVEKENIHPNKRGRFNNNNKEEKEEEKEEENNSNDDDDYIPEKKKITPRAKSAMKKTKKNTKRKPCRPQFKSSSQERESTYNKKNVSINDDIQVYPIETRADHRKQSYLFSSPPSSSSSTEDEHHRRQMHRILTPMTPIHQQK